MQTTREITVKKNKKLKPHITDDEAKQLLETLETYCELFVNYTLINCGDKEDN